MELKLNSGDVITIPDGCRAVIKDKIIAIEKEVQEFKDGDFVSLYNVGDERKILIIYKIDHGRHGADYYAAVYNGYCENQFVSYNDWCFCDEVRIATGEEKQFLLDAIHADGKDWDADNKQIVDYQWKPKIGDTYYYIDCFFDVVGVHWCDDHWDNLAYNNGNCFKTEDEAKKYSDKFIEILKGRKL